MFKEYYASQFKEIFGSPLQTSDGLGDELVQVKLQQLGLNIPKALVQYYAVAGLHWINKEHNRLRDLEELEWFDDKLVFIDENQWVVYWGISKTDLHAPNPTVWCGTNGNVIQWYDDGCKCAQFIMAMWEWTITELEQE
ncbi:hypothetical protein DSM106972_089330 [Dulcicalothrix desertica PCC 7102]|uniref:Knr4/Smi1-like domain-containing protein n=1 Tax=Dulcicalothrix desertica PCC 7102 TaxID=232991 RepID=A0A433UPZ8_9CYAN|nr:hypothetical protein [Dulcicalothrix desertica]RUS95920.1 hypothetical protein DSM106972_089330 [Dulcicalothrix desertica PCC 7102]TWH39555.1 hypothetical protein CAL7102_08799 [Dulcicalothrix desertica PCC 7102]